MSTLKEPRIQITFQKDDSPATIRAEILRVGSLLVDFGARFEGATECEGEHDWFVNFYPVPDDGVLWMVEDLSNFKERDLAYGIRNLIEGLEWFKNEEGK